MNEYEFFDLKNKNKLFSNVFDITLDINEIDQLENEVKKTYYKVKNLINMMKLRK